MIKQLHCSSSTIGSHVDRWSSVISARADKVADHVLAAMCVCVIHALYLQVLVFNCDEGIDFQSMGRIFIGLTKVSAYMHHITACQVLHWMRYSNMSDTTQRTQRSLC
jgi:hypothetical protein